jgi:hypothetical protein
MLTARAQKDNTRKIPLLKKIPRRCLPGDSTVALLIGFVALSLYLAVFFYGFSFRLCRKCRQSIFLALTVLSIRIFSRRSFPTEQYWPMILATLAANQMACCAQTTWKGSYATSSKMKPGYSSDDLLMLFWG